MVPKKADFPTNFSSEGCESTSITYRYRTKENNVQYYTVVQTGI
jgi:hypothetical protein